MAHRWLSAAEREQLTSWPGEIPRSDLAGYFTLTVEDVRWLRRLRAPAGVRLALAVQICALGYLGYLPADVASTPATVADRLAARLGVPATGLAGYPGELSDRSRREHAELVITRAGWRSCGQGEWKSIRDWLLARALEHDTPSVLFGQVQGYLRSQRIVRPGLDRLARAVASARAGADVEIRRRLAPQLSDERCGQLDALLVNDPDRRGAPLVWLGTGATTASAESVKAEVGKLAYLRDLGADRLDLSAVPPERLRQLAAVARRSTPGAMRDMDPDRRYPMLLAALAAAHTEIVDEVVQLFDQALAGTDARARHLVAERQREAAAADVGRLVLLDEILDVVLDPALEDGAAGAAVRGLGHERLTSAARPVDERLPGDGGHLQLVAARYSHVRSFAPQVLGAVRFHASVTPSVVLDAVTTLAAMNSEGRRRVPPDTPTGFVPARWQPYLDAARTAGDENRYRHYWELCALFALQAGLRSGEIWVQHSRRYANPASYLIPGPAWPAQRTEVAARTGVPTLVSERLDAIGAELDGYLDILEPMLRAGDGPARRDEHGRLHLTPLAAENVDPVVHAAGDGLYARLPTVPLTEILIDIDRETGFSDHLTHAGGGTPRHGDTEHRRTLYAALLAQACNFGATRMAELSGIPADAIDWVTRWYLREDTLRPANTAIVNKHYRHPLAQVWGGGTLSSSDGLRLPMRGKSLTARSLSRYFLDEGVTSYTHISDQHSTYGTQIIVSTDRDATYVLDEILGNTTELPILEHATDSHGQTLITFALFDLLGKRLSPRIAKLPQKQLWRPHPSGHYQRWPLAGPLLTHRAHTDLIAEHWDDLQRIGGSLLLGHVSAALLITRLQAGSRQHPLAKALLEYGKLLRTVHALRWFTDEAFRRRIGRQLNRGEALNDLRRFVFFAHRGQVRYRHHDDQTTQAHCHTLVVNACILSTTWYLHDAVEAHRADGHDVSEQTIAHLSPARFEAINPYGTLTFDIAKILNRTGRRPLIAL